MKLRYKVLDQAADAAHLIEFLSAEPWPYHGVSHLSRDQVKQRIAEGTFSGTDKQCFWIVTDGAARIGFIKLFELDDIADGGYPLFDLRVQTAYRGRGIGLQAVKWLTRYLFETWPELDRISGTTRDDNYPMRKVFLRCGYVKEGHFRKSWDDQHASVHYGILREDWESGKSTPVPWDDQADLL